MKNIAFSRTRCKGSDLFAIMQINCRLFSRFCNKLTYIKLFIVTILSIDVCCYDKVFEEYIVVYKEICITC